MSIIYQCPLRVLSSSAGSCPICVLFLSAFLPVLFFLPSLCVCVCTPAKVGVPCVVLISPSLVHLSRHVCASTRVSWLCAAGLSSCVCLCACICFVRVCVMTSSCQNFAPLEGRNKKDRKLFVEKTPVGVFASATTMCFCDCFCIFRFFLDYFLIPSQSQT